jgi:hypothetical protein
MQIFRLILFLTILPEIIFGQASAPEESALFPGTHCLNKTEETMAASLNQYRRKKGLKPVPLSVSLSWVARKHVEDLAVHYEYGSECNLHSWSQNEAWTSCCYDNGHKDAECMWDKPRELTSYTGDGYEIAFFSTHDYENALSFVNDALEGWKTSPGHHDVILNRGKWRTAEWNAMGIGANDEFIVVWFGEKKDSAGPPEICR